MEHYIDFLLFYFASKIGYILYFKSHGPTTQFIGKDKNKGHD